MMNKSFVQLSIQIMNGKHSWYNVSMLVFDTICALSTPRQNSALAIVRLSGEKAVEILSHLIRKDVNTLVPNQAFFAKLYQKKEELNSFIDEAVVTYFKGPNSYTGFDLVEFATHGSMIVVEELLDALTLYGARRALQGEFSCQAYYNGKMDLLKAEGVNDLINANSTRAKKIASSTLNGENANIILSIKKELLEDLSKLEYFVENQYSDFDESDYPVVLNEVSVSLQSLSSKTKKLLDQTKRANREYQGIQVAIAGEPNAGKSTLLNRILGKDKAIVSPIPGTTRDVVEGEREIDGIHFHFDDTAGLRETDDLLENLGIQKSYETIKRADLVLLCSENGFSEILSDEKIKALLEKKNVILVSTKSDINQSKEGDISVSETEEDLSSLFALMLERLDVDKKEESCFLGKREEDYLFKIHEQINLSKNALEETGQIDIISDTIHVTLVLLDEMLGNSRSKTMEDIYQTLFSHFCLGK